MSRFLRVHAVRADSLPVQLGPEQRCPYCRAAVRAEEALVACALCRTVLHEECAKGGCSTLGCAPPPRLRLAPPRRGRARRVRWARVALAGALLGTVGVGVGQRRSLARGGEGASVVSLPELTGPTARVEARTPGASQHDVLPPGWTVTRELSSLGAGVEVQGDLLFLRGEVDRPGRMTLIGPDGERVSWDQGPGRFQGAVTIPGWLRPSPHGVIFCCVIPACTVQLEFVAEDGTFLQDALTLSAGLDPSLLGFEVLEETGSAWSLGLDAATLDSREGRPRE